MKTVAYYISDYGYGHASRSIAVIRQLLKEPKVKIIVCHSFALPFIKASLNGEKVSYRNIKTDIGYFLEKESIYPDKVGLLKEYKSFVADWQHYIQKERGFLSDNNVDLVVSDISPLPFEAAESLGIPSVGISNFTWYTAYQGSIDDIELKTFKKAYQKMTYFYSLAGSQEQWNLYLNEYGFFSREVDGKEVQRIRHLVDPEGNKKIIFLGLGMKIDVGSLEQLPIWDSPDCVFLVSSNLKVNQPNVFQIPSDYLESQNYIAASDLLISKAGWGMIGEAVCANVPLLILNRPSMKEDQNTINYLKRHHLCKTIEWDHFETYQVNKEMISNLRKLMIENDSYHNNQAGEIAAGIMGIIKQSESSI
ncbi:glycosyltransferase [Neobacillus soli]|uniref:glycosyltransferase n=1 Tax=Neobacillus soli TaxID=220688 RepID=UPI0008248F43|nr:glycosyltransferase [Neobacillus soli]